MFNFQKKILGQCTYIHILWIAVPHQTLHWSPL